VAGIRDHYHLTIDEVRCANLIYRSVDNGTKPIAVMVSAGRRGR
jgi:hypothetical protein